MPLRWIAKPPFDQSPLAPEEPKIVLAAAGSIVPGSADSRRWVLRALAAGSLAVVAFRPYPAALPHAATTYTVTNLNPSGPGSLRQAINNANDHPGADIVDFQAGLTGTIPITTELSITDSVQIVGPGPGALSVSGSNTTRVFYLYSSSLITATISGLTIRDGRISTDGAGILDDGQALTLDNVAVVSNTAFSGSGGGVDVLPSVVNQASLVITDSLISGNLADAGAGIYLSHTANAILIENTQIISNSAAQHGGGNGGGLAMFGGAHTASLTIRDTLISGNHARQGAGIFGYKIPDAVLIQNTRLLTNTALGAGGGIKLYDSSGDTTIEDSTLSGNYANYGAGGMFYFSSGGQHVIRRTTISGNRAHFGGGLSLYKLTDPFLIEDSTISGNHATYTGGGIYVDDTNQPISIRNSTIVSNTADTHGGGIEDAASASLPITDTIIAGNTAPLGRDISGTFQLKYDLIQVTGTATITASSGNIFGLDPLLGPLADNGGPTQTHLARQGSPAIDAGDPAFAPPPATDQRGDPRVVHGRIDIGAVETTVAELKVFLPLVER
jgi:parallel beta-helix repeat protein